MPDIEKIAQFCHEVNRAYCQSIGDYSQLPWDEAPEWQKQSARKGVQFHLDTPTAQARDSHQSWFLEKLSNGWSYGPTKDEVNLKHPAMVPFEELPADQQIKDHLFRNVVHAAIAVGL